MFSLLNEIKNTYISIGAAENTFHAGLLESGVLGNENDIEKELNPLSITEFFETLKKEVSEYYGA